MKRLICVLLAVLLSSAAAVVFFGGKSEEKSFIKYVEFNVTRQALGDAVNYDIESGGEVGLVDTLAYLGAKYGGDFDKYNKSDMDEFADKIKSGADIDALTGDMRCFSYYRQAYSAVLGSVVGNYTENGRQCYGVRLYSPIAKTFPYSDFDDFGARRTYGYSRPHLGHDMIAATGAPVIAVEGGEVECMGWNRYGGWRIGIRSDDRKRYWYYAHLRQNRPYAEGISEGDRIEAGQVIGYVGRTGYSDTENVNNIETSHLHIGLELVFDESQKESDNEIWVDLYAFMSFLEPYRSEVIRNATTKEFTAVNIKACE